ncbi:MAG: tRNA pseudouridine(38-40) synthase TruA, partial [Streptosporangiales bacterium]|nr:tRNA pseudouridine(38-40) synthase TruA [Streptosporangiales bacterium]
DGREFSGWATQPGRRTVQETVEAALTRVLRLAEPARLTVAGRTDAGVHATGQVAHVDLPASTWADERELLVRRLAGVLPADVRVRAASAAPDGFDARFSALARRYAYRVCDDPAGPDPLRRHDTVAHNRPLDAATMDEASRALVGEHDFAAYCRPREGATTVRTLLRYAWRRDTDGVLVAEVVADAFCHNMVRALVGAAVAVGEGRRPVGWPAEVLARGVRDPAVTVLPAHGLTLVEVRYPPDAELAARAARARNRRVPPPRR